MTKTALITGASSGIGKAIAENLAKNKNNVIILGRRIEKLQELKAELVNKYSVDVLILNCDVRNKKEVIDSINSIPETWKKSLSVLVNNAGLASGLDKIQNGDYDDWEKMIDTNVKGLLYVTKEVSKILIENKKGHIINIGSIAGKEVYLNGNVYCASKHAVDALTKAMRVDMVENNIKVTQIAPGMVNTEFSTVRFHGDKKRADDVYKGFEPLFANDIANIVEFILNQPEHVCINDIVIMPTAQASSTIVCKKL